MADNNQAIEDRKLILEEWKVVIQTQMHFNEMIMTMRTTGITIVLAFFGAASITLQYNTLYLSLFGYSFHASVLIIISGLILLAAVFVLDYFYYYKMLRGAVNRGYEIDNAYEGRLIDGMRLYGLSTEIHKAVSLEKKRRYVQKLYNKLGQPPMSKVCIIFFYGLVFVFGIVFVLGILLGYHS